MNAATQEALKELTGQEIADLIQFVAARAAWMTQRDGKRPTNEEVEEMVIERINK